MPVQWLMSLVGEVSLKLHTAGSAQLRACESYRFQPACEVFPVLQSCCVFGLRLGLNHRLADLVALGDLLGQADQGQASGGGGRARPARRNSSHQRAC